MKHHFITDAITYVEPDSMARFSSCAGLMVKSLKTVFIDMNLGRSDTRTLLETEHPDAALVTHYHLDHSVWTRQAEASGARVFVPESEKRFFTGIDWVVDHTAGPLGYGEEWRAFVNDSLGYKPLSAFSCFDGRSVFTEFVPEMVLVETPGHSPGHTSFYFPDEKILFSGDMGLDRFGPWYGWQDCSVRDLVSSLLRLDGMDLNLVLTGHGGLIRKDIHGAIRRALSAILEREKRIRSQLAAGEEEAGIVARGVFFKDKDRVAPPMRCFLDMWDTSMFRHHKALLEAGGLRAFFPELAQI